MKRTALALAAALQTYPGQPTQGHVRIDNRGPQEALPVIVQQAPTEPPLKMQVVGTHSVTITAAPVLDVREARQTWEYQRLVAQPDEDVAPALNRLGAAGWEAALQYVTPGGAL